MTLPQHPHDHDPAPHDPPAAGPSRAARIALTLLLILLAAGLALHLTGAVGPGGQ